MYCVENIYEQNAAASRKVCDAQECYITARRASAPIVRSTVDVSRMGLWEGLSKTQNICGLDRFLVQSLS
jgi:hypothetical protein